MAEYVNIFLDHAKLGCGWRRALVLTKGPKWVKLFYPASLDMIEVPRGTFDSMRPIEVLDYSPSKLAKRIRAKRKQHAALELYDGGRAADDALGQLKG